MKGVTGRFIRKIKSISTITSLRQGLIFHASNAEEGQTEENCNNLKEPFPSGRISVSEALKNEVQDEEFHVCWKENMSKENAENLIPIPLQYGSTNSVAVPLPAGKSSKETEITKLPNPFELMVMDSVKTKESEEYPKVLNFEENLPLGGSERVTQKAEEESEEFPTLLDFEENCPPEGNERVILYTTSLKGIRKTFQDCNSVRFLLESFKVIYFERDLSMHLEFREELWQILGGRVVPPQLFIKGRHIGGAEEVVRLHEQGRLRKLFQGIPMKLSSSPCGGCGGVRFVVCSRCNGSRKVIPDEPTGELTWIRCLECNDNGLVKCRICC